MAAEAAAGNPVPVPGHACPIETPALTKRVYLLHSDP